MLRGLWLFAAAVIAAGTAFVLFPQAPALVDVLVRAALGAGPAVPADEPYIAFSVAVGIGLFAFFLATVAAAALWEGINITTAARKVTELLHRHRRGDVIQPHDFVAAAEGGAAQDFIEQYAQGIHKEQPIGAPADGAARFVSEISAASLFLTRGFIEKPLFLDMLRPLPSVFFGLGAFGLLIGLVDGLSRARAPSAAAFGGESFARGFESGLVAAMAPLLLGVLCWFAAELVVGWRGRRVQLMCRVLDSLFPPATPAFYLRQLAAQTGAERDQARQQISDLLAGIGAELTRHFARLEMNLEGHETERNDALKNAVVGGFQAPVNQLAAVAARLADDQSAGVEKLLDGTLAAFVAELQQVLRGDLIEWQHQLATTGAALDEMRARLAETDGPALAAALGEAVDGAMAAAQERQAALLARLVERAAAADSGVDGPALAALLGDAVADALVAAQERQAEMIERLVDRPAVLAEGVDWAALVAVQESQTALLERLAARPAVDSGVDGPALAALLGDAVADALVAAQERQAEMIERLVDRPAVSAEGVDWTALVAAQERQAALLERLAARPAADSGVDGPALAALLGDAVADALVAAQERQAEMIERLVDRPAVSAEGVDWTALVAAQERQAEMIERLVDRPAVSAEGVDWTALVAAQESQAALLERLAARPAADSGVDGPALAALLGDAVADALVAAQERQAEMIERLVDRPAVSAEGVDWTALVAAQERQAEMIERLVDRPAVSAEGVDWTALVAAQESQAALLERLAARPAADSGVDGPALAALLGDAVADALVAAQERQAEMIERLVDRPAVSAEGVDWTALVAAQESQAALLERLAARPAADSGVDGPALAALLGDAVADALVAAQERQAEMIERLVDRPAVSAEGVDWTALVAAQESQAALLERLAARPAADSGVDGPALAAQLGAAVADALAVAQENQAETLTRLVEHVAAAADPIDGPALVAALGAAVDRAMTAAQDRQTETLARLVERLAIRLETAQPAARPPAEAVPFRPAPSGRSEQIVEALEELTAETEELPVL